MSFEKIVIGFIGGGNMAKVIAEGILKKGLVKSDQILVSHASESSLETWNSLSINTQNTNTDIIDKSDLIFLSFKPNQLESVVKSFNSRSCTFSPSKLFVSILAGVTSSTLYEALCTNVQRDARLIRVMPNTAALVCESCSAVSPHSSASPDDVVLVQEIFSSIGKCEVVPEYMISAITGLTGSGPAYIFMIIEALSDGGVKQGLPRNLATQFAAQTMLGAAKMVLETKKHPGELKDEVCSAGGTTIYGLHALEKGGLRATLMNAVEAAVKRGDEIGRLAKNV